MPFRTARRQVELVPLYFDDGIASSFHIAPITMLHPLDPEQIIEVNTNENWFQASKSVHCFRGTIKMFNEIAKARSARLAKTLGHKIPLNQGERRRWDEFYALLAMMECNLAKFTQHDYCREWLVGTGNRPLIEHRRDKVWGDGLNGTGRNQLGKVLEVVRVRVR